MIMPKSFKKDIKPSNPDMNFIDIQSEAEPSPPSESVNILNPVVQAVAKPPAGFKNNPLYIESKTRRLQVLMQPSLYKRLKQCADTNGLSVNQVIHDILDKTLD
jgi:hypothetical protein